MSEKPHDEYEFDDDAPAANEEELIIAHEHELTPAPWWCAACGQPNSTLIDPSAGFAQEYVEDCAVCCRPNLITLHIDEASRLVTLRNELEYE